MMANTITLTREQADAVCEQLWRDLHEQARHYDDQVRLMRAAVHFSDAIEWGSDERQDSYEIQVDGELAWLATEALQSDLDELAACEADEVPEERPWLAPELRAWVAEQNEQRAATKAQFCTGARALAG